jgi:tetratricopeptide (TPR) repeat protein
MNITPQDHSDLAMYLNNLGNKLQRQFEKTERMEDLKESICQAQQVMNIMPQDHLNLAEMLNNLGSKLQSQFEKMGRMEDLKEAIHQAQQAVDITLKIIQIWQAEQLWKASLPFVPTGSQ